MTFDSQADVSNKIQAYQTGFEPKKIADEVKNKSPKPAIDLIRRKIANYRQSKIQLQLSKHQKHSGYKLTETNKDQYGRRTKSTAFLDHSKD